MVPQGGCSCHPVAPLDPVHRFVARCRVRRERARGVINVRVELAPGVGRARVLRLRVGSEQQVRPRRRRIHPLVGVLQPRLRPALAPSVRPRTGGVDVVGGASLVRAWCWRVCGGAVPALPPPALPASRTKCPPLSHHYPSQSTTRVEASAALAPGRSAAVQPVGSRFARAGAETAGIRHSWIPACAAVPGRQACQKPFRMRSGGYETG